MKFIWPGDAYLAGWSKAVLILLLFTSTVTLATEKKNRSDSSSGSSRSSSSSSRSSDSSNEHGKSRAAKDGTNSSGGSSGNNSNKSSGRSHDGNVKGSNVSGERTRPRDKAVRTDPPRGQGGTDTGSSKTYGQFPRDGGTGIKDRPDPAPARVPGTPRPIVVERSGQTVVVAQGPAYGYVQRPVAIQGHQFYQRTYYNGGSTYTRIYRPSTYHGIVMPVYCPVVYYTPAFYLWATNPWKRPVRYRAWASDSWLYESYFAPDPSYTSPLLWLADYLITCFIQPRDKSLALQNLQFWLQRLAAGETAVVANGQTTVTPDVKQLIADEVRWELNQEQAEAAHAGSQIRSAEGPPPILAGGQTHVFVVQDALTADAGGRACTLTEGDVLRLPVRRRMRPRLLFKCWPASHQIARLGRPFR